MVISKTFKFVQIPIDIIIDETIPPLARLLYGEILVLSNKDGYCFATNQYLGQINKVDSRTIRRLIHTLEDKNYIKVVVNNKLPNSMKRKIFII